ncbi:MAG: TRAP transporter fused permease subunit [Rhodobacteraceae bacterium]|nr:TRAP transporter fused permease subunit [Paracoccaceae bacterium]MCY4138406.1 TRAP transporter fused permease subunit [Paracoccaceae bacterium]
MASANNPARPLRERILLIVGFCFAVLGFLNAVPDLGPLPSIGVIPASDLHPTVFACGFVISFLAISRFSGGSGMILTTAFNAILVCVGLYALWSYNVAVSRIEDVGLFFFEDYHAWMTVIGCVIILYFCWRIWGLPLAVVGTLAFFYFFFGEHLPGILGHAGMDFIQDTPAELWYNTGDGVMGNILAILVNTVFPFIIMGAVLEGTGGGSSMIKLSFHAMRRFRGGPAHAAIMASSLFGTVSGSAVANVVGTGVITIPMIKKRGFRPAFAGGVEATASTGGQIMPPIMGAAALVMADFIAIDYLIIIFAAIVPAAAYYASLFTTVVFEARSLGVEPTADSDMDPITLQDWISLILVIVPISIVVIALILGFSAAGSAMIALSVLLVLSFLNPEMRRKPILVAESFAKGGVTFGRLLMAIGTVSIIIAVLGSTGLPLEFAKVISSNAGQNLLLALIFAAVAALILGMGMPTLPAYLTIIIILGPSLTSLGLTDLTAHFFVFYFGVASAITPPVAMAAFAAASISGGGAIGTAVQATRIGIVIFAIPFFFAFNPQMLIVAAAGGLFTVGGFVFLLLRLALLIYMLASAASRFDRGKMPALEVIARAAAGLLLIHPSAMVSSIAVLASLALISLHYGVLNRKGAAI